MRFNLVLQRTSKRNFLPFNYKYEISSWIYRVIAEANADFSKFLHEEAYQSGKKKFKLFTFSNLDLRPFKIHKEYSRIEMQGNEAFLQISFLIDKAAENFIKGLFLNQTFTLGDRISNIDFIISRIEVVGAPVFREVMTYQTISPVCVSVAGEKHAQYVSPEDDRYEGLILSNLLQKLKVSSFQLVQQSPFSKLDDSSFRFKLLSEPRSRLILIKAFTDQETKVRGYDYKFEMTAPSLFQEIAYYAGIGEKGSAGFGSIQVC